MELTPVFPPDVNPVNPGPYQWIGGDGEPLAFPFHVWTGAFWLDCAAETPASAIYRQERGIAYRDDNYFESVCRGWRGVLADAPDSLGA